MVLARILKMPVLNSIFKISACSDLATQLLQIHVPTILNSLLCQKRQFTLQPCLRRWFVRNIEDCTKRRFSGNCLSKRHAGQVLAKSLVTNKDSFYANKSSTIPFKTLTLFLLHITVEFTPRMSLCQF